MYIYMLCFSQHFPNTFYGIFTGALNLRSIITNKLKTYNYTFPTIKY